jgi:hypothetical protein
VRLLKCAGLTIAVAAFATSGTSGLPSMTIRVLDQVNLPVNTIHKMEKHVSDTLSSAGIDVRWVECSVNLEACNSLRGPNEFWLRIISEAPAAAGTDKLGFTQRGEAPGRGIQCVNVIYSMVQKLLPHGNVEPYQLLGAAVAHEIGHLYLGSNNQAHSKSGVMRGVWSWRDIELSSIGELVFSRDQAQRIRAAMRSWDGI